MDRRGAITMNYLQAIRDALRTLDSPIEAAIRDQLSASFDLGHSERLQFEISVLDFRIHLIQTEEDVLAEFSVMDAIPQEIHDAAEVSEFDLCETIAEEVVPWFAERWRAVGGDKLYSPAYLFFHGGLESPRYDLERNRWLSVAEVWPDA
jgi:hypothetical protein